jgi:hypothetical protein
MNPADLAGDAGYYEFGREREISLIVLELEFRALAGKASRQWHRYP